MSITVTFVGSVPLIHGKGEVPYTRRQPPLCSSLHGFLHFTLERWTDFLRSKLVTALQGDRECDCRFSLASAICSHLVISGGFGQAAPRRKSAETDYFSGTAGEGDFGSIHCGQRGSALARALRTLARRYSPKMITPVSMQVCSATRPASRFPCPSSRKAT